MRKSCASLISGLFLFFCSAPAFAYIDFYDMRLNPVISIGPGAMFAMGNTNGSQNFPIVNPVTDEFYDYQPSNPNNPQFIFNFFLGNQFVLNNLWAVQAGIDYGQSGNFGVDGTLTQGADVFSEDVYRYHYNIQVRQLLAEGKLLYQFKQNTRVHPYIIAGIGAAFNTAMDYNTTALYSLVITREYQNRTNTTFSYTLGAGVDVDLNYNVSLGLGYRFTSFGEVSLGSASLNGQSVTGTISQNPLLANELVAEITYFPFAEQFRI
jgi:opacity protein-like surface antigen